MAQVKDCMENMFKCAGARDGIPKSCVRKTANYKSCKCKSTICPTLKNYKYVQPKRSDSCKPVEVLNVCDHPFDENSIYSKSYQFHDSNAISNSRQKPVIKQDNLKMAGEFNGVSVQMLSYQRPCGSLVQKIKPRDHRMMGEGCMRLLTTQKHDYYDVQKDCKREDSIKRHDNLYVPNCPMDSQTTNAFSYRPVEISPVKNCKPLLSYTQPAGDMNLETVTKNSYRPHEIPEKPELPWAVRLEYCKPNAAVECCTVYNESYAEPGKYVLEDGCENVVDEITGAKIDEDCCPFHCLAENFEDLIRSPHVKAHEFED
ncbi:uncharacterized protein LOC126847875 [Adelges cooleyi]|uniref:uncharacterized protein LOC126847875 n=1 Tax=Adelges cooleyi TaxID=133065 RepID=UPI00217F8614|nr:uncharacterized protein LOC126847875 [Adelges cooleyi]